MEKMNVYQKLQFVQKNLKAPKSQYNKFGKYYYRSCEDILTAVKPLLDKVGAVIILTDEMTMIGNRFYIKATARLIDAEGSQTAITNTALAREDENKKGMDGSQITGTASSYARKYALNGLLLIDDTKDADTDENREERENRASEQPVEDRTGESAYPPIEKMVMEVEDYVLKHPNVSSFIEQSKQQVKASNLNELAAKKPAFIQAVWNKWCNK